MALTLKFDLGDDGVFPCTPAGGSLDCAICGSRPPYTVTITRGAIKMLTATSFRITAPDNTGGAVAGAASRLHICWTQTSGISDPCTPDCGIAAGQANACINIGRWKKDYGCNGVAIDASWVLANAANCGGAPVALTNCGPQCSDIGNCDPNGGTIHPESGICSCIPVWEDLRTQLMKDQGCAPCVPSMADAVVTVTDADGNSVSRTLNATVW